jgi:hypothetical protein
MCLPATLRSLKPANLFCNIQCTTVCITAASSQVAKRTPGMYPGVNDLIWRRIPLSCVFQKHTINTLFAVLLTILSAESRC